MAVDCRYAVGDYRETVEAGRILLSQFPESRYELRTRYTIGWAHFQREEFAEAAEVFRAYVAQDSESVRANRVRLQLGLALEQLERQEEALAVFAELAETCDPSTMSFEEQTQAALAGLREGQSRRSLAATSRVIIAAKPVMVPTVAVPVCESCCDNEDDVQPNLRHSFIALHRSARS